MKIITVTLAPNQAVLTCYLQDQSPKMPNAAIRPAMLVVPGGGAPHGQQVLRPCTRRSGQQGTGQSQTRQTLHAGAFSPPNSS